MAAEGYINADMRAAGQPAGVYVPHITEEPVKIHHMAKEWVIGALQQIRENEEGYERSRVYRALLRELRRRQKEKV